MFDQMKQLHQLKKLQAELENKEVKTEINGAKVVVNGKMEVKEIILNPDVSVSENAENLKKCFNESVKKIQKEIAGSIGM